MMLHGGVQDVGKPFYSFLFKKLDFPYFHLMETEIQVGTLDSTSYNIFKE